MQLTRNGVFSVDAMPVDGDNGTLGRTHYMLKIRLCCNWKWEEKRKSSIQMQKVEKILFSLQFSFPVKVIHQTAFIHHQIHTHTLFLPSSSILFFYTQTHKWNVVQNEWSASALCTLGAFSTEQKFNWDLWIASVNRTYVLFTYVHIICLLLKCVDVLWCS